jgi:hypothetical protein
MVLSGSLDFTHKKRYFKSTLKGKLDVLLKGAFK